MRRRKLETKDQNKKRPGIENCTPENNNLLELSEKPNKQVTEASSASTPPSLSGIERRIA